MAPLHHTALRVFGAQHRTQGYRKDSGQCQDDGSAVTKCIGQPSRVQAEWPTDGNNPSGSETGLKSHQIPDILSSGAI